MKDRTLTPEAHTVGPEDAPRETTRLGRCSDAKAGSERTPERKASSFNRNNVRWGVGRRGGVTQVGATEDAPVTS